MSGALAHRSINSVIKKVCDCVSGRDHKVNLVTFEVAMDGCKILVAVMQTDSSLPKISILDGENEGPIDIYDMSFSEASLLGACLALAADEARKFIDSSIKVDFPKQDPLGMTYLEMGINHGGEEYDSMPHRFSQAESANNAATPPMG